MQGVVMPLHYDSTDNFYVPFFGRKKVVLVEPGHLEELGRFPNGHPLAGSARADVDLDVLDDLEIFETVVAPGDVSLAVMTRSLWYCPHQPPKACPTLSDSLVALVCWLQCGRSAKGSP